MQESINHLAPVSQASVADRSEFIWKVYAHVGGAILAFAAIEVYFFQSGIAERIAIPLASNWLLVLGGFILASWLATHVAHRLQSTAAQYAAFAFFVFVEAIIFVPMLYIAMVTQPGVIDSAAGVTLLGSVGLIATAMITRKDFSFLRGMLVWGGILALIGIGASLIFGFELGTWFSVAMIGFAGAAVLYDTSNIMHHYPQDKYVAASMALFASIALMFWYILRLFMSRD
ncbi:MAG: Bax inhibitor-1 family protein [Gammaproteobacteria bacterium]|jgi:FtsH-binding integral membrane protein|nr:Bax inhibitor-1 family protein [Gammaproteobacteria bacterium]MDH3749702.1 Bax inhibitor-1 family protein [Gammaproteobacteria bacterium]MDH3806887.1 Bax inhibitor-1 family protein [Gammaproteobacteria bacterium]